MTRSNSSHNEIGYQKWGLIGICVSLWALALSGIILRYSDTSDFNYTKGQLVNIQRVKYDVKDRMGGKIGIAHKLLFVLDNSQTIFYIDNNFSDQHIGYMHSLKNSKEIEVWSDGDILDGKEERVYKLKGDGISIVSLDSTKEVYVEKSQFTLYLAILATVITVILIKPKWFRKLIADAKNEQSSLVHFYETKFEDRKSTELENIVSNKSDFHPDAVKAAKKTLKRRKFKDAQNQPNLEQNQ